MERIYHRYELWEDHKAGFYNNVSGEIKKIYIDKCIEMFIMIGSVVEEKGYYKLKK
jgi:hypothetical protein